MTSAAGHRLFDIVPPVQEVERLLRACREEQRSLHAQLRACDLRLSHLTALAHALRELAAEPPVAAVAARLAESGWSGTGEQLVTCARAVHAGAETP